MSHMLGDKDRTGVSKILYRMLSTVYRKQHRPGLSEVPYGMFKRLETVRVCVEYRTGVTLQGEGGRNPQQRCMLQEMGSYHQSSTNP